MNAAAPLSTVKRASDQVYDHCLFSFFFSFFFFSKNKSIPLLKTMVFLFCVPVGSDLILILLAR